MKRMSMAEQTLQKQIERVEQQIKDYQELHRTNKAKIDLLQDMKAQMEQEKERLAKTRLKASVERKV